MNNAVYVDWLDEALEAAGWQAAPSGQPWTWRLEYLASAARGDEVVVQLHGSATAWTGRIRRGGGQELVRASGLVNDSPA